MKTILIVDDEYDILSSLEMVFKMEGFNVKTAFNGMQGLEILKESPCPDVILSDIMMPELDGYGFVKALKAQPHCRHIPVILASAGQIEASKVDKADYKFFIRKPFDLDKLIASIEQALKEQP